MKIIFTDIDGVLNPHWRKKWDKKAIKLYNDICNKYDLKPVITSTWRIAHDVKKLQSIFEEQGINIKIYDYTPVLYKERGLEIKEWLNNNKCDNFIVLDDRTLDIEPFIEKNVVKCRSWIGFSEEEYNIICNILDNDL
jgi:hypothetical protein